MNAPAIINAALPRCLTSGSLRPGWVYCIRDDAAQAVKIGFSTDPMRRLAQLQTANPNPLRLIAVMRSVEAFEQFLHWSHADRRIAGEWFRDDDEGLSTVLRMAFTDEPDATPSLPLSRKGAA